MKDDPISPSADRLLSLDFMRGLIMVLLALEGAQLYDHLFEVSKGTLYSSSITPGTVFGFGI